jgi:hypothetical protein
LDSPANNGTPASTSVRNFIANFTLWAACAPPPGIGV